LHQRTTSFSVDSADEFHVDTSLLNDFLFNYYHYDLTFGKLIHATEKKSVTKGNGVRKELTSFTFDDHTLSVENEFFADNDSLVTSFYYDRSIMRVIKNDEERIITAVDLDFGNEPTIIQYTINNRLYYYIQGYPKKATGRFAQIVYGIVYDVLDKRIYEVSTYSTPGDFFFKKESGKMLCLLCRPLEGDFDESDSLIVRIKVLNY
jgi:hypothetical protein